MCFKYEIPRIVNEWSRDNLYYLQSIFSAIMLEFRDAAPEIRTDVIKKIIRVRDEFSRYSFDSRVILKDLCDSIQVEDANVNAINLLIKYIIPVDHRDKVNEFRRKVDVIFGVMLVSEKLTSNNFIVMSIPRDLTKGFLYNGNFVMPLPCVLKEMNLIGNEFDDLRCKRKYKANTNIIDIFL